VELLFVMHPRHAKIKTTAGSTQKATINIMPEKKYDFKILSAKAEKGDHIQYELKDVEKDGRTTYQLTVENTVTKKGRFFDTLELEMDSDVRPEISVWVFVEIKDPYDNERWFPTTLLIAEPIPGSAIRTSPRNAVAGHSP